MRRRRCRFRAAPDAMPMIFLHTIITRFAMAATLLYELLAHAALDMLNACAMRAAAIPCADDNALLLFV